VVVDGCVEVVVAGCVVVVLGCDVDVVTGTVEVVVGWDVDVVARWQALNDPVHVFDQPRVPLGSSQARTETV
jgi:hypothetical protein